MQKISFDTSLTICGMPHLISSPTTKGEGRNNGVIDQRPCFIWTANI